MTHIFNLEVPIPTLECALEIERDSRRMFVARLENMPQSGRTWLTIHAVLALLNDCDMLAQQTHLQEQR